MATRQFPRKYSAALQLRDLSKKHPNPSVEAERTKHMCGELWTDCRPFAGPLFDFRPGFFFTTFVVLRRVPRGLSQEVGMFFFF